MEIALAIIAIAIAGSLQALWLRELDRRVTALEEIQIIREAEEE